MNIQSGFMNQKQKIALITLGCPKNQVDSEVLAGELRRGGAEFVGDPRNADTILINTCGFVADAKSESIEAILDAVRLRKNGRRSRSGSRPRGEMNPGNARGPRVVVWGCLSERYKDEIRRELPEVDAFFGIEPFKDIGRYILGDGYRWSQKAFCGREPSTLPHTAYLKIADGCDHRCTFCAIPSFKGKYRSRSIPGLVREAEALAGRGVKELILIAQDTTAYGRDLEDGSDLVRLLKKLVRIGGIEWIRILYGHPAHLNDALIDTVAGEPRICKTLDLPLQHISDPMLKAMGRGMSGASTERLITRLRNRIPGLVLRTAFIVGFPGETEAMFGELLDFIRRTRFERLGAFEYSPEEGTRAFGLKGAVRKPTAHRRYRMLMEAQQEIAEGINRTLVSKIVPVIVDGLDPSRRLAFGRTQGDSPDIDQAVWIQGRVRPGDIVPVRIEGYSAYDLAGTAVPAKPKRGES
jgi:ribosomal protein S12 methylthiotransferase